MDDPLTDLRFVYEPLLLTDKQTDLCQFLWLEVTLEVMSNWSDGFQHRRQSLGLGCHDPQILGWGSWGLHDILWYPLM